VLDPRGRLFSSMVADVQVFGTVNVPTWNVRSMISFCCQPCSQTRPS
jgi:hypothetical protein